MVTNSVIKLNRMRDRHHSQWGEDGLLEYVLSKLPVRDKYLVEFGAWDGKYLSNSFHAIEKLGYSGILIEMNLERFNELEKNMAAYKCICINSMVGYEGTSKLDFILGQTNIPRDFDLLSVDIDGNDYQVWEALVKYKPKVVVIEINSFIPPGVDSINKPDRPFEFSVSGSSISAMYKLGAAKGYKLIANVGCNAIFVCEEFYGLYHQRVLNEFDFFTFESFSRKQLDDAQRFQKFLFSLARPNLMRRLFHRLSH